MSSNLLTEWARLLLASLAQSGVSDVIISPGSRSTPFVMAATRTLGLRCHDCLDERSAGFMALGQTRVTGMPSVVIATSGSAGAHYLPAVVEAGAAHLPLIVLTADRPFELQECGAAQTIDQVKMFGSSVRQFFELGLPDGSDLALRAVRRIAAQAVFTSRWPIPGAVHINARARKPLEPYPAAAPEEIKLRSRVDRLIALSAIAAPRPVTAPAPSLIRSVAESLTMQPKGVIACGSLPVGDTDQANAIEALARRTGYPLLVEASSQLRFRAGVGERAVTCDLFDAFLSARSFREKACPQVVVQIGGPLVASSWEQFLEEHTEADVVTLAPHSWCDPQNRVSHLVVGDLAESLASLNAALYRCDTADLSWAKQFVAANCITRRVIDRDLADAAYLTEGIVARTTVGQVPRGSFLFLGNSLPIRLVDWFCPAASLDIRVLCQRGANGIDGNVAGVLGAASVGGCPVTALIGDVTFLHDLSSLARIGASEWDTSLAIVVIQNFGGRIFERLPLANIASASDLAHFITPHEFELRHAAALYGHRFRQVRTASELAGAITESHRSPGCTVIEAIVRPQDIAERLEQIWQTVATELEAGL
ncbi:MAG: 2-succinyl-5-enolpyruvyl-6-hydroxy-3-cyclohexene-1-carboxylic-acid synthase [Gammaproteobacteria bacterium]